MTPTPTKGKLRKDFIHIGWMHTTKPTAKPTAKPRSSSARCRVGKIVRILAKAIINLALLWIGEYVVGFGRLLETLFGGLVVRVYIRVILAREFAKSDYLAAVARCKELIAAGDVMQVQIGQRISKQFADAPLSLYRALRTLNPSPYMYYYDLGDAFIVGASPEILVRSEERASLDAAVGSQRMVAIRPIAGTRPRGGTPEQDALLAAELAADPKERAEHLMLIDLARNDIGRIAQIGSVRVTEQMVVERYSHVQHLVSHVEGRLKPGMTNFDVLRATFPAGTLSGAPKVRAMEIIDELETRKRGIYGGAVGYLSFAGDMDLAIAIRTGIIKNNVLYVQAAAGIVADSVPEMEWRETEAKARAVLRAAEQVEDGFDMEV